MEASVVHVRWVQFLQELQRTEPPVCRLEVIGFEHVGHVYLLVGPGLLSMSPARRSLREMTAGESFLGVEKSVCVLLCVRVWNCPGDRSPSQVLVPPRGGRG